MRDLTGVIAFPTMRRNMIRERLQELTGEQLHRLADRYELDSPGEMTRDELIEAVAEAINEHRLEREAGNDHPVAVQEKKYEFYIDAVLDGAEARSVKVDDWELPEQYNETRIVLLLRDPSWAYVYWEINESYLSRLAEDCASADVDESSEEDEQEFGIEFDGLALRVHELPHPDAEYSKALYTFTIPVQLEDHSWYINLPNVGTHYCTSIVAHTADCVQTLAVSNVVSVPPGDLESPIDENPDAPANRVLSLTNLDRMPVETYSNRMPQRLISLPDE